MEVKPKVEAPVTKFNCFPGKQEAVEPEIHENMSIAPGCQILPQRRVREGMYDVTCLWPGFWKWHRHGHPETGSPWLLFLAPRGDPWVLPVALLKNFMDFENHGYVVFAKDVNLAFFWAYFLGIFGIDLLIPKVNWSLLPTGFLASDGPRGAVQICGVSAKAPGEICGWGSRSCRTWCGILTWWRDEIRTASEVFQEDRATVESRM